jgi:hypothetical protein
LTLPEWQWSANCPANCTHRIRGKLLFTQLVIYPAPAATIDILVLDTVLTSTYILIRDADK